MFGVELERQWGTRFFVRYYAITGIGAGLTTMLVVAAAVPADERDLLLEHGRRLGRALRSAAGVRDVLPERPILMFLLFPVPAKYFVMILGAIAFLTSISGSGTVARHHAPGRTARRLPLPERGRGGFTAEIKYRYTKWKMNRMRRKFDVYSGGRSDWDRHVH